MSRAELFIGGAWREGRAASFAANDPATGVEVWRGRAASPEDVADAVASARRAFPLWAATRLSERQRVARDFGAAIEARKESLAVAIMREMGKPLWEARAEVASVVAKVEISIRAQAERAGEKAEAAPFGSLALAHRPYGVMAVLGPFNFPAHLPNGHIVPALLAGNAVVFKPSEQTPGVGALYAEAWQGAGLPPGVLNLVQGGGEVGAALVDAEIDGVLFTGSHDVGRRIHGRFAGRPEVILALEMGGNNPLIAWPPLEAEAAANLVAHSAFATSGQRCSCARRLIVPEGEEGRAIVEAVKALAQTITVAPGDAEPPPFCGPLANVRAAEKAEAAVAALIGKGARPIVPWSREGAFVRPCLLDATGVAAPDEEIFAPVLLIRRAASFAEAIAEANATRYGLAATLLSDDPELWEEARLRLRAGVLNWNRPSTGASSALPFGGPGWSGSGRPSAFYAADYCAFPVASQLAERAEAIPAPGLPA